MTILCVILLLLVLLLLLLGLLGALSVRATIQGRFDGGGDYFPHMERIHPGWQRRPVSLKSDRGDTLRGDLYYYDTTPRGLIVLSHGYGMTIDDYLPECEYFCRRGYGVLAVDGSGMGRSDGILYGLPQHLRDLRSVLEYVRQDPELSSLPLLLYGHSWGGWAVDTVSLLGDFPIRGIVSASGFYVPTSGLGPYLRRHWGPIYRVPLWGILLYQRLVFGRLSGFTAAKGLRHSGAPALVLQSEDDPILFYRDNFLRLRKQLKDVPSIRFRSLQGRLHNIVTPPETDAEKRNMLRSLRNGTATAEELQKLDALKAQVDEELLSDFADFYDECIM